MKTDQRLIPRNQTMRLNNEIWLWQQLLSSSPQWLVIIIGHCFSSVLESCSCRDRGETARKMRKWDIHMCAGPAGDWRPARVAFLHHQCMTHTVYLVISFQRVITDNYVLIEYGSKHETRTLLFFIILVLWTLVMESNKAVEMQKPESSISQQVQRPWPDISRHEGHGLAYIKA